ncbi:methyltransferase [[Clostridium] spiroforme]|nr:methyltransferase [Thomasclavelia spiroformis]MBM6880652.1 methyltransferase [Thomasclavelia spiroformis]
MKEYFYLFNYPPEDRDLCHLECQYLFHQPFQQCLVTSRNIDVDTSVFIKAKIDIWAFDQDFLQLMEKVKAMHKVYERFKVIYLKNPKVHVDYQESLKRCQDISWYIDGSVDMAHPLHTIALTKLDQGWYIGYYHHGVPSWKKHDSKPHTFSNSLDIRLARTLINIAGENDFSKTLVDPCCGMATVVLEGLALGYDIKGFDISREISWKARNNLIYFGYDGMKIRRQDIRECLQHFDVAIIDIPYNLYTPVTYLQQCQIIEAARKICDKLVLVSYEQMDQELQRAHFVIADKVLRKKTEYVKFGRYIYVCY